MRGASVDTFNGDSGGAYYNSGIMMGVHKGEGYLDIAGKETRTTIYTHAHKVMKHFGVSPVLD